MVGLDDLCLFQALYFKPGADEATNHEASERDQDEADEDSYAFRPIGKKHAVDQEHHDQREDKGSQRERQSPCHH